MINRATSRLVLGPYSEPQVIGIAKEALQEIGGRVSCGFVFVSADYEPYLTDLLELIQLHAHVPILAGCSGSGLIATAHEEEAARGFSLLLLYLPNTRIHTARLPAVGDGDEVTPQRMFELAGPGAKECSAWIFLGNPYSLAVEPWLDVWNGVFPGIATVGGLASGGMRGDSAIVFQERQIIEGGVVMGFAGGVNVRTLVSQGCRPVSYTHLTLPTKRIV